MKQENFNQLRIFIMDLQQLDIQDELVQTKQLKKN